MFRFTTAQDAAHQVVIPALADAAAYDVDAIVNEAFAWRIDVDENGNERLNTGGFQRVVDTDTFWKIVAKHAIPHEEGRAEAMEQAAREWLAGHGITED